MKGSPILVQVAALAFATLVLAFSLCLAIVWVTPAPPPTAMTVRSAATALQEGGDEAVHQAVLSSPPPGVRVPEVEAAVARHMGVSPEDVRVSWADDAGGGQTRENGKSVIVLGGRPALVDTGSGGVRMQYGGDLQIDPDAPMPSFRVAVREAEGGWRMVTPIDQRLEAWRRRMLLAFGVALVLSTVPVLIAAGRLSRPVRRLASAAEASVLDDETPFRVDGPAEVRAVAVAMNAMHKRLAGQAQERFEAFTAIAHDLRTPLTGLRIRAERIPSGRDRDRMIDDLDRMAGMINDVLEFARVEGQQIKPERVNLSEFLSELVSDRHSLGLDVRFGANGGEICLSIDRPLLHRAIDNLVDNALRFGGSAELSTERREGEVDIHVDDFGPGVPAAHLAEIIMPFRRLEQSRSRATGGAGLGLAIANRIAVAHGGALTLSNRDPRGLRATIKLPVESPS